MKESDIVEVGLRYCLALGIALLCVLVMGIFYAMLIELGWKGAVGLFVVGALTYAFAQALKRLR